MGRGNQTTYRDRQGKSDNVGYRDGERKSDSIHDGDREIYLQIRNRILSNIPSMRQPL